MRARGLFLLFHHHQITLTHTSLTSSHKTRMKITSSLIFFFIFFSSSSVLSQALVPLSKTFKYVNQGELFTNLVEYNAYYRPLPISNYPFFLSFFNTTPDSFTLGLSMGSRPEVVDQPVYFKRWVWSANRARPVRENAAFVFGRNGNLVLLDSNGRVAWQTKTANKGVVDIKLLPNGNLVLLNQKGQFVWQSFDYPTDTLLAGQSLHAKGVNKLVSRASDSQDSNGLYNMVLEDGMVKMYFKSKFSPKPLAYETMGFASDFLKSVTFFVNPSDQLGIGYLAMNRGLHIWAQPKYNSSLSMLRLGYDGNLHVFTYYEKGEADRWEETYTYFSRCELPEGCGAFGLCVNSQCVACPSPKGLLGWSDQCKPSKIPACGGGKTKSNVGYYKMDGVDHFLSRFFAGEPNMTVKQCQDKCSKDCKCVAFFHTEGLDMCLTTNELNTLTNSGDPTHTAYIKYAK